MRFAGNLPSVDDCTDPMVDRIKRRAAILVDHCTEGSAGDEILIKAPTRADDLVVALHERLGSRTWWI